MIAKNVSIVNKSAVEPQINDSAQSKQDLEQRPRLKPQASFKRSLMNFTGNKNGLMSSAEVPEKLIQLPILS